MSRLPNLPDFSQFVQTVNRVKVYNTVNLLIGVDVIEVNGIIISQKSQMILDLVGESSDLCMDDFIGELKGVQECIELLYGGQVVITTENLQTMLKFSVKFEVDCLYEICLEWINQNVCQENLYLLITAGLMVEQMRAERQIILKVCTDYIKENIQDDLLEISKNWNFLDNGLIRFFIQKDILSFTLRILTSWIESDTDIRLILDQLEIKGMTEELSSHGAKCDELVYAMTENVEVFNTSKRLLKLKLGSHLQPSSSSFCSDKKDLKCLMSQNYVSFPVDQMLALEEEYHLEHFDFVEVLVPWITINIPSQSDVSRLWGRVRQEELNYYYVWYVRNRIQNSKGRTSYSIPSIVRLDPTKYQYYPAFWAINCGNPRLTATELDSLLNKRTVMLNIKCEMCKGPCDVKLKLDDKTPCYELDIDNTHCIAKHWFIVWNDGSATCHYSLITNNYNSVATKIKECMRNNTGIALYCLYQCVKK